MDCTSSESIVGVLPGRTGLFKTNKRKKEKPCGNGIYFFKYGHFVCTLEYGRGYVIHLKRKLSMMHLQLWDPFWIW